MAKANMVLPDGTKVTIDGTADEVATLLGRFSNAGSAKRSGRRKASEAKTKTKANATRTKAAGPTEFIRELITEGYFKTRREIGAVRDKLEERGHIYPVTSISGPLLRRVKNKELRRIKENGAWKYVNP
jgi:hypothetical protein